jgi:acetylornithine deacetylase/succinyl-diaminopimelate desuccinylase-like protein
MRSLAALAAGLVLGAGGGAQAEAPGADQAAFRAIYKELVETDTSLSAGSCTLAAERMAARLKAAGFADEDLTLFSLPDHPREGGLVAMLRGADPSAKGILLLAHLDVVEAKREDWTRDPFKLIEENGFFYGRGASDDKAMGAIFVDAMARLHAEPRLRRAVKLALTCGEETSGVFNGAEWLAKNRRELIDADFALNEGGGGRVSPDGRPLALGLQVAEKTAENYTLEAVNPGGHSSLPRPDNAIYQLIAAVAKVQAYRFPAHLNPTTIAFFERSAAISPPDTARAMRKIAANPADQAAEAILRKDPLLNSTLRTTCVATLMEAGHAENALPQRARANINCRIVPGETVDETRQTLVRIIADRGVSVTAKEGRGPIGKPTALDPQVLGPAEALARELYPGLPVIPTMSTGASDSIHLAAAGIPSYGAPGLLYEYDGGGIHGLNEHIRVSSVMKGREYLYRLIKAYAAAP